MNKPKSEVGKVEDCFTCLGKGRTFTPYCGQDEGDECSICQGLGAFYEDTEIGYLRLLLDKSLKTIERLEVRVETLENLETDENEKHD